MNKSNQPQSFQPPEIRCMPADEHAVLHGALKQLVSGMHCLLQRAQETQCSQSQWIAEQLAVASVLADLAEAEDQQVFLRDWILETHELARQAEIAG